MGRTIIVDADTLARWLAVAIHYKASAHAFLKEVAEVNDIEVDYHLVGQEVTRYQQEDKARQEQERPAEIERALRGHALNVWRKVSKGGDFLSAPRVVKSYAWLWRMQIVPALEEISAERAYYAICTTGEPMPTPALLLELAGEVEQYALTLKRNARKTRLEEVGHVRALAAWLEKMLAQEAQEEQDAAWLEELLGEVDLSGLDELAA